MQNLLIHCCSVAKEEPRKDPSDPFSLSFSLFLQDGSRGHLEGLASVYCELLMAPFGDVLSALEEERIAAWLEVNQTNQHRTSGGDAISGCSSSSSASQKMRPSGSSTGLPNSHSQPIYVPGKYSVSKQSFLNYVRP